MRLKVRKLFIENPLAPLAIVIGMILLSAAGHWILSQFLDTLQVTDATISSALDFHRYLVVLKPILILLGLYGILKFTHITNPLLIALAVAILSICFMNGLQFLTIGDFSIPEVLTDLCSIFVLVTVWVMLVQTMESLTKAISLGYLAYLFTGSIAQAISGFDEGFLFSFVALFFSLCFDGVLSSLFRLLLRIFFRLLNISDTSVY